jgi:hypothetical protein
MTHRVDPAVQRVEPAPSHAMSNPATADSQGPELRAADDGVLARSNRSDLILDRSGGSVPT